MIELRNLTKRFGQALAVDDVGFTVRRGEFFTLLGPSGCGKTTLLRLISGFETPDAGTILLEDADVTALPPFRRPVNQVFQSYALFPHLSVEQNVEFGLKMAGVPRAELRQRVAEAIEMVSLRGLERRKPAQLSGGQKQRVALARAIVNRPKMLLLDEPLAALDAKLREAMRVELKQLQQTIGISFIFVTHDQDEALTLSDQIAMMSGGRILQIGSPRELYEQPESLAVAKFIGLSNVLPAEVSASMKIERPDPSMQTIFIRPEDIDRCNAADALFEASVTQILYRGEIVQFQLRTDSGETLLASGWDRSSAPAIGETVHCRINPGAVRWFADR